MLLNCGVGKDSWESLGLQGDLTSSSYRKSVLNILWRTDAEAEALILMQRTDSLEKTLMLGKTEGRRRRGQQKIRWLDGISDSTNMSWASSGNWWWPGKPGMLQSMGSQKVEHKWATELNWSKNMNINLNHIFHGKKKETKMDHEL